VAFAYVNIGKLFMADPAWALQVDEIHSRLMTIVAAVLVDCPGSASHREVAGHQFRHWGCPLLDLRVNLPHAEEALREAAAAFEKCTVDFPNRAAGWHYAADTRRRLGLLYMGAGRLDEAEQELRSAVARHEQRAARFPVKPEFQLEWSLSNFDLGHFLSHHRHDDTAAIEAYQDALRVKPDLTAASERVASLQQRNSRPDKVPAE
jgi:tetratricopeptide (TPR) repeat protein